MSTIEISYNERTQARSVEIVNITATTKALRLYEADGNAIELGILEPNKSTSVMFIRHGGEVFVGYLWMNPSLFDADGNCLEPHCPGTSLRDLVTYIAEGRCPSTMAYFTDLNCSCSVLSIRLVFLSPYTVDPAVQRYLEAKVDFHRMPKEIFH